MGTRTEKAVKHLTSALKKDKDFWYGYKANIAVAFQDEFANSSVCDSLDSGIIHEISNRAAERFLKLWCS